MAPTMKALLEPSIRVVELGESLAGSYCGRLLQQLGAGVTAVEPTRRSRLRSMPPRLPGSDVSATYTALTEGKRIVRADFDQPAGRASIEELLAGADVVIMSGTLREWEERALSPADVRRLAPTAVVGRVTTFGDVGPYAQWAGGELQAQALGGLMNMIGEPDAEPIRIGGYPAQYSTGLALLAGISLGLFRKDNAGRGSSFSTSVIETVAHMEWKTAQTYAQEGKIAVRGWRQDPPLILPCRDGFFAFFYLPHDWDVVRKVVQDPRLDDERFSTQPLRQENRDELVAVLTEFTLRHNKVDLYHLTQAHRMTTGYVASISDLFADRQYLSRGFFDDVETPGFGPAKLPGAPWRWVAAPAPQPQEGQVA
ncbi:hypothetical protein F8568_031670 [Actinomadura sp. LD22]|uniref:CoA transferase n=1 Tax=Actinomadura physcomitrii TaxID=2650748 RepID=A0A6I4MMX6_9ACTN|nr:CoA transferase [Actinomadura physcomitrii]MWA04851.1 hypothetical protein [Actinomadura physcomitrii]